MKVETVTRKIKCDVGGCGKNAAYAVVGERTGAHTAFYLCPQCADGLRDALRRVRKARRDKERRACKRAERTAPRDGTAEQIALPSLAPTPDAEERA